MGIRLLKPDHIWMGDPPTTALSMTNQERKVKLLPCITKKGSFCPLCSCFSLSYQAFVLPMTISLDHGTVQCVCFCILCCLYIVSVILPHPFCFIVGTVLLLSCKYKNNRTIRLSLELKSYFCTGERKHKEMPTHS